MEFELAQGRSGREAAHAYNFYGGSSDHEEEEEDPAVDEECSSSGKQHHRDPSSSSAAAAEREHMFDKVVTPSDVGKLNRLVIPKQHAEKYFPLDTAANEKGLLLSFEDRTGKPWRFRYSYWNSSQSYVMTKGWSRFVKEKRLDAGDTVSFGRAVGDRNTAASNARLFIDWKRRPDNYHRQQQQQQQHQPPRLPMLSFARSPLPPWGSPAATAAARILLPSHQPASAAYEQHRGQGYGGYNFYNAGGAAVSPGASGAGGHYFLLRSSAAPVVQEVVRVPASNGEGTSAAAAMPMILDSVPVSAHSPAGGAKRVRLFGVNLDCPESDGDGRLQLRLGGSPSSSSSMSKKQQDSPPWDLDM